MKASFEISETNRGTLLSATGDLTVQASRLFKEHLDGIIERGLPVQLSLENISTLDASAIQIIYLFRKRCEAYNATAEVILPAAENLITLLTATGLLKKLM